MKKNHQIGILGFFAAFGLIVAIFYPDLINDKNKFLDEYVNHEMLAVFFSFSAISLPMIAIYLDKVKQRGESKKVNFPKLKIVAVKAVNYICGMLAFCLFLVFVKGLMPSEARIVFLDAFAVINAVAMLLNILLILVIHDIMQGLFEAY